MISKQDRVISITNRGSRIYDRFAKYDIIYNLKIITRLSTKCVYKDNEYKFSACMYYSYYVILHLLDEKYKRRV